MTLTTLENANQTDYTVNRVVLQSNYPAGSVARRLVKPREQKEISYEFTNDPALLHQYYRLREEMFISVWGLNHYSGSEDIYDNGSHILISRRGLQVVGGIRLTISSAAQRQQLPIEGMGIDLQSLFPELDLKNSTYCELSRLAILPEFRDGDMVGQGGVHWVRRAIAEGVDYAFNIAPVPLARNYRQSMQNYGFQWKIRNDIKIADRESFEGIKMMVSVLDLTVMKNRQQQPDVASVVEQLELAD
jgi:hypothetical protein